MAMSDPSDMEPMPADDAHLLAELREALDPDPPPAGLVERAEGLMEFMRIDRELAALLDAEGAELAGTRGAVTASEHLFRFEVDDGSVSLELTADRERLGGLVLAGELTGIALERLTGDVVTAAVDELGRFSFGRVPPGPARLRLLGTAAQPVTTDWFVL
jgi:hypothetical protein